MAYILVEGKTNPENAKVGIVVSRWNSNITDQMLEGALDALKGNGISEENIIVSKCPGSFEIPLAAQFLLEKKKLME